MARKNQDPRIGAAIRKRDSETPSICPCKRSFKQFVTPLKRQYLPKLNKEWEPTIGDFLTAGGDLTEIMSFLCQLTNEIHPIFRDENICSCPEVIDKSEDPYQALVYCLAPHFADNPSELVDKVKGPEKGSLLAKDIIMRTILQLATQIATKEGTLPFWAGLVDFEVKRAFKVHPRRRLDQFRKGRTLQHLLDVADRISIYFQVLRDDDGNLNEEGEGFTGPSRICPPDPLYETYKDTDQKKYYGHQNGKRTIEDRPTPFIFVNIAGWRCLQPSETLVDMTVAEIKIEMFYHASTICHELAHAIEQTYVDMDKCSTPVMNDEVLIETGFSLENFLYGGVVRIQSPSHDLLCLLQWPCEVLRELYAGDSDGTAIETTRFGDGGPERWIPIDAMKAERFLEQSFWDDPNPPVGYWKKLWLRPAVPLALDWGDFGYYTTGDTPPFMPESKRRRLSDATKERQRVRKANVRWKQRMQLKFRWHRSKEISEERKAVFHEQEMGRLNELWAECTKGIDGQIIPK